MEVLEPRESLMKGCCSASRTSLQASAANVKAPKHADGTGVRHVEVDSEQEIVSEESIILFMALRLIWPGR